MSDETQNTAGENAPSEEEPKSTAAASPDAHDAEAGSAPHRHDEVAREEWERARRLREKQGPHEHGENIVIGRPLGPGDAPRHLGGPGSAPAHLIGSDTASRPPLPHPDQAAPPAPSGDADDEEEEDGAEKQS
ncbi:hypothetical protein ACIQUL_29535 [Streptomyces sp. NPDC090303]|uniref:hypothetical protein n=1 Tax=Streptomyces sp. NPDC090303 TaxID=3365960 RepID=UPI00380B061A